jgi:hypothetical protein
MKTRTSQLMDEIGLPLLCQTVDTVRAENAARTYPLGEWLTILMQLDAGDPTVLLPYLQVPAHVQPHVEVILRDRKLKRQGEKMKQGKKLPTGRPPVPSYMPMAPKEAYAIQAARFVTLLKEGGADEEKAIELMSLMYNVPASKLRAVLKGKASGARNLRARRAAR